ncbi:MAG: methylenetetrahydrofolate reductase [NAD(P)H] [Phycisphaerales bacterium]|nr:methylenetetrahydrofolate reductase [NAD(P)H] [Phycisphaerales bacterium]
MHIQDIFANNPTTFSFEFFPPKSPDAADALFAAIAEFEALKPTFVSVTYGAGGSTRELTRDLVIRLKDSTALDPVPHLTCVCHNESEIGAILERYAQAGISNIIALGGDVPRHLAGHDRAADSFRYAADLVSFIRRSGLEPAGTNAALSAANVSSNGTALAATKSRRGFGIGVAGYPEGHPGTPNRMVELDLLKAKVDAGADYICTQLFFDNHDFFDFRDRCDLHGIKVPILAGIMPITSVPGMMRMAEMALGAHFPAPLLRAINRTGGDPDAVRRVGVHWATEQCRDLLDHHARGIHFYTLNRSTATREIYLNLGVQDSQKLMAPAPVWRTK